MTTKLWTLILLEWQHFITSYLKIYNVCANIVELNSNYLCVSTHQRKHFHGDKDKKSHPFHSICRTLFQAWFCDINISHRYTLLGHYRQVDPPATCKFQKETGLHQNDICCHHTGDTWDPELLRDTVLCALCDPHTGSCSFCVCGLWWFHWNQWVWLLHSFFLLWHHMFSSQLLRWKEPKFQWKRELYLHPLILIILYLLIIFKSTMNILETRYLQITHESLLHVGAEPLLIPFLPN